MTQQEQETWKDDNNDRDRDGTMRITHPRDVYNVSWANSMFFLIIIFYILFSYFCLATYLPRRYEELGWAATTKRAQMTVDTLYEP